MTEKTEEKLKLPTFLDGKSKTSKSFLILPNKNKRTNSTIFIVKTIQTEAKNSYKDLFKENKKLRKTIESLKSSLKLSEENLEKQ
jgi:hypothetical protein